MTAKQFSVIGGWREPLSVKSAEDKKLQKYEEYSS
jgi:hypothetical protein